MTIQSLAAGWIETARPNLALRLLNAADAAVLHRLVSENVEHLTRHGDYREMVDQSSHALEVELAGSSLAHMRFGIFLERALVGREDLIGVQPPKYSISYWLAANATGQGYASSALKALIDVARRDLQITDLYSGVTHGNRPSEALLQRVGFQRAASLESYTRFHLGLGRV